MQTNLWIARSQRFYRWLLRLYPQVHREVYEAEMFRMFTSQCQDAYKQRGNAGILFLWPRTLFDLGVTVIHEHLIDPQARLGLLEANPNVPLPWKGVLLVLIPGLIFFVSQIAQLTSTTLDWFYMAYYRAAYYMIVPVLLVWLFTRRFPVWGLMPIGLLFSTLWNYSQRVQLNNIPVLRSLVMKDTPDGLNNILIMIDGKYLLLTALCMLTLGGLIWYNRHHRQISGAAWWWLGVYLLLILLQAGAEAYRLLSWQGVSSLEALQSSDAKYYVIDSTLWLVYDSLSFLILIFVGLFFTPKHGGFSFLILLGYLLPTIVFGRYGEWNDALPFYLVSTAIVIYRFVIAFVAPIWLARAASVPGRKRAAAIPVAIAIISHISLNIIGAVAVENQLIYSTTPLDFVLMIWNQVLIVAGLGLAVTLYLPNPQETVEPPILTAAPK